MMGWTKGGITLAMAGAALLGGLGYIALREHPVAVDMVTIGIALLICTVSTIAPSWWAARMLPVDGLRYE